MRDGQSMSEVAGHRPWAYSAFRVTVARTRQLSPGFLRITFTGESLRNFAPWGLDQRIKLVLPMPDGSSPEFGLLDEPTPHPSHWYARWRELPETERNVLRTYTPAAIRPESAEIDVDVFVHEPPGPASAWAATARPGDSLVITGPDIRAGKTGYGIHYTPGPDADRFLLIGDETALPAIGNILDSLAPGARAEVFIELADPADDLVTSRAATNTSVHVIERGDHIGANLLEAVRAWGADNGPGPISGVHTYVWIAGETAATTTIRRYIARDLGVSKENIAFLGYWRLGGPLGA